MQTALAYLNELIESGIDYPDAEYRAAKRFSISADDLREAYDLQF